VIAGDLLGERTRLTPDKLALVYAATGERFTYTQLNERAVRCALVWTHVLKLRKGDRIGILAQNCVEYVEAFAAAGKTGVILVPLNTRLTGQELEAIVRDSGMRALMYESQFADVVAAMKASVEVESYVVLDQDAITGYPGTSHARAESTPPLKPKEGLNGAPGGERTGDFDYRESARGMNPAEFVGTRCADEDIYCLVYTSGTTGKPKGVMLSHRMVLWNAYNTALGWQLREDDVSPIFTPMCHAGGLGVFLTSLFAIGGTVVLHRGFDATEVWRTIEAERCSVVMGVPTIYRMLMDAPEFEAVNLSSVRWFISGGAPLPLYIIDAYQRRGVTFKQGYGLTEVGVNCFTMTEAESRWKLGSIGKPLMFTEMRLVDGEGRDVSANEVGELWIRGPHVCSGYWKNSEATAASLDKDGWFHTGDLARRDEDGFYYIAGRLKDMLISGGVNVYPAEIEGVLLLHEAVQDAAVVGVAHETWGEVGVAFVVARPGVDVSAAKLSEYLGEKLAKYKVPREFVFVEQLPRTAYGKVVKRELQERYAKRSGAKA
jgi:fatty-acyl-CoA synthase